MLDSSIDQCIHVFRISFLSLFIFAVVDLTELEVNDKMSPGALLNKLYPIYVKPALVLLVLLTYTSGRENLNSVKYIPYCVMFLVNAVNQNLRAYCSFGGLCLDQGTQTFDWALPIHLGSCIHYLLCALFRQ